jgi:hypothetical protein
MAALLIVAMFLFPPFHDVTRGNESHIGYFPIFAPPGENAVYRYSINLVLLMVQWLGFLIVAALLWIAQSSG